MPAFQGDHEHSILAGGAAAIVAALYLASSLGAQVTGCIARRLAQCRGRRGSHSRGSSRYAR